MKIELRHIPLPDFGIPVERPAIPASDFEARCDALYDAAKLDWVAVYADREHFANLTWLTGYDPRFEEALLLLGPSRKRVLLVGVEGVPYAEVAGLELDVRFYHPFSILGQPHTDSPPLADILRDAGIGKYLKVGIAGWKTADPRDLDPTIPAFVPNLIVRVIDSVTAIPPVDVTAVLAGPDGGLRGSNTAAQIALFEWGAARASAAVLRVLYGTRPGMTELDAAGLMAQQGEPVTMHPIVSSSEATLNGLRSPSPRVINEGDAISCGIGMWGGLCCRAGVMATQPDEAFLNGYIEPYFRAIATWWSTVGIGVTGSDLVSAVTEAIGGAPWQPFVNPGHLTSYDEWIVSFSLAGNATPVAPGMAMQADIIPTPLPPSRAINCEDSLAIGDDWLRARLASQFPSVWHRIQSRREFMADRLGIELNPEVLPLSVAPAYLPPCWLSPDLVCTVTG
jgi:hypothetical protein